MRLRTLRPEIKALVCSAFYEPLTVENAINAKVQGFITKTSDLSEIALAVKMVASGKGYFCTEVLNSKFLGIFPKSNNNKFDNKYVVIYNTNSYWRWHYESNERIKRA